MLFFVFLMAFLGVVGFFFLVWVGGDRLERLEKRVIRLEYPPVSPHAHTIHEKKGRKK
jgi:hypothetical protein